MRAGPHNSAQPLCSHARRLRPSVSNADHTFGCKLGMPWIQKQTRAFGHAVNLDWHFGWYIEHALSRLQAAGSALDLKEADLISMGFPFLGKAAADRLVRKPIGGKNALGDIST